MKEDDVTSSNTNCDMNPLFTQRGNQYQTAALSSFIKHEQSLTVWFGNEQLLRHVSVSRCFTFQFQPPTPPIQQCGASGLKVASFGAEPARPVLAAASLQLCYCLICAASACPAC